MLGLHYFSLATVVAYGGERVKNASSEEGLRYYLYYFSIINKTNYLYIDKVYSLLSNS